MEPQVGRGNGRPRRREEKPLGLEQNRTQWPLNLDPFRRPMTPNRKSLWAAKCRLSIPVERLPCCTATGGQLRSIGAELSPVQCPRLWLKGCLWPREGQSHEKFRNWPEMASVWAASELCPGGTWSTRMGHCFAASCTARPHETRQKRGHSSAS